MNEQAPQMTRCANVGVLQIERCDPRSAEAIALMEQLTAELTARYDFLDDGTGNFRPEDADGPGAAFLIGRVSGEAVACAALRPMSPVMGEIKRVYVVPAFRGRRFGHLLLTEIERVAAQFGYHTLRLETGTRQPESLALYEKAGYCRIPNYEPYVESHWSVCFEKPLIATADPSRST
jgi:GNAT superfamily N-acetyltransferase